MAARFLIGLLCSVAMWACAPSSSEPVSATPSAAVSASAASALPATESVGASSERPRAAMPADRSRVVFLGDSLTAGLGVDKEEAYPAVIQRRLDAEHLPFEVVNAGVSGDTSAGGLRRLDWSLDGDVRVLVVALGGNDGLRGLPVTELRSNLQTIIDRASARKIPVLLCGMEAPPNFGSDYTAGFRQVYRDLAKMPGVTYLPFLLDGVAGDARFNQADGIHPNPEGARRVAELVWNALRPMLAAPLS